MAATSMTVGVIGAVLGPTYFANSFQARSLVLRVTMALRARAAT